MNNDTPLNERLLHPYRLGRQSVYRAAEGLSQADAVWKPAEHLKSIQGLLVHIGGAERFWLSTLGYVVLEFPKDDDLAKALSFLQAMETCLAGYVQEATPEQLCTRQATDRGELSLAWTVKRVTQHMFYHLGTLVYLRSLREPDWHGDAGLGYWQTAADAFGALIKEE